MRGSSITLLVFAAVISLSRVDASAGRAFPIESENYVTESFQRINSRLEWDNTNFLIDLAGHYANCDRLGTTGEISIDRQTPEGETVVGFVDNIDGTGTDVDSVNSYIHSLVDRWTRSRTYNSMIREARRFGCSVRPGCSRRAVVSCLFSPGRGRGDVQYDEPEDVAGEQHALAFTEQQYVVAERYTGNKWDRSHMLENLSGYETSCAMIDSDDWPFTKARTMAADFGLEITGVYGHALNEGSTDIALDRILQDFKQIQYASALGCSIIPHCVVGSQMYVVVSCIYQQE